jgi:hypothetical protein
MFRLLTEILAIATEPNGKKLAATIPAGEVFKVFSYPSVDDPTMVDITWNKAALLIFADDIELRCVEVLIGRSNH